MPDHAAGSDITSGPDHAVVMTTTETEHHADELAAALVAEGLAACVQLIPITSHYVWEGETTRAAETLLLCKTAAARVAELTAWIETHHPYDTPEVVALPVLGGSAAYLAWMDQATAGPRPT